MRSGVLVRRTAEVLRTVGAGRRRGRVRLH